MYKLILCIFGILVSNILESKNKDQIVLYDSYGKANQDVVLILTWKPELTLQGFSKLKEIYLHYGEEIVIKAPYSYYHLDSIKVAPESKKISKKVLNDNLGIWGNNVDIGYNLLRSLNDDQIEALGDKFFIIKGEPGKQIYIQRCKNEASFRENIKLIKESRSLIKNK
ncbi:MAG: hypothetical protein ACXWL2_04640 [Candidatus Chromulinivorax sp.]